MVNIEEFTTNSTKFVEVGGIFVLNHCAITLNLSHENVSSRDYHSFILCDLFVTSGTADVLFGTLNSDALLEKIQKDKKHKAQRNSYLQC